MGRRCPECFNFTQWCVCVPSDASELMHPSYGLSDLSPIDKIATPEDRERMLREYAERGATELELLANDNDS